MNKEQFKKFLLKKGFSQHDIEWTMALWGISLSIQPNGKYEIIYDENRQHNKEEQI